MDSCESTTLARRNRTPFAARLLAKARADEPAPPLFVQAGRGFRRAPDELVLEIARQLLAEHFRTDAPLLSDPARVR
jgi:hypothetical protein